MNPLQNYRRTRILTATPGELLVMLYDGLLQRVRAAAKKIDKADAARAGELLGRCQDILHELMRMLDVDKAPELADSLFGLYGYASGQLLAGIRDMDRAPLDEVVELLKPLRDAWAEANEQLKQSAAGGAGATHAKQRLAGAGRR